MEALEAARLAAPEEIHDVPTARMPALALEDAIARSIGPRGRLARGSSELEAPGRPMIDPMIDPMDDLVEVPMVRTFPARHPWLVTAAALAVTFLLLLALHGTAGP
jgi:hypothetical protein